jgi:hypothetical protein
MKMVIVVKENKLIYCPIPGADPGFQVRGGGALKQIGRRERCWGISCEKSRFYAKKIIFFPILGGRAPGARTPPPLGSAPAILPSNNISSRDIHTSKKYFSKKKKVILGLID